MEEKGKKLMPSNVHKKCIFNAHQPNDGERTFTAALLRTRKTSTNILRTIMDNLALFGTAKMILIGNFLSENTAKNQEPITK